MSCEVANSPFSEPGFPDPFDNIGNDHGSANGIDLSAISEFNSGLNGINQDHIDPQSLSHANSPTSQHDPTLTPEYTLSTYPIEFDNISQAPSPYFQSTEAPFGAPFIPAATQNFHHLHRRSVSEPPDGALMHHPIPHPHPTAPVFFHRDGHKLGVPRNPEGEWRNKKAKNSRAKPYQQRNSPRKPAPQPIQSRYMLRRPGGQMQTQQSTQLPPTSIPRDLRASQPQHNVRHGPPTDHQHQMQIQMPHSPQPQYVSSRLCTPAPEAIDPFLSAAPPGPMVAPMMGANQVTGLSLIQNQGAPFHSPASASNNVTMLKMGVEELRALIADVVREAVGGLQAQQAARNDDGGMLAVTDCFEQPAVVVDDNYNGAGNGGDDEEIVVAGSFGDTGQEAIDPEHEGEDDVREAETSEV